MYAGAARERRLSLIPESLSARYVRKVHTGLYHSRVGGDGSGGPADGVTVLHESVFARDGLYGLLSLVVGAALVRGVAGAATTAGLIAVAIVFGALPSASSTVWPTPIR